MRQNNLLKEIIDLFNIEILSLPLYKIFLAFIIPFTPL